MAGKQQQDNKNNSSAKGGSITDKSLRSVWLEGAEKSKSIRDSFGKSLDQIGSQIRERQLTKIESAFKDFKAKGGLIGQFISKYNLKGIKLPIEDIKKFADEMKVYYDAAMRGVEVYNELKNGNYAILGDALGPVLGDGFRDALEFGLEGYDMIKNTDFKNFSDVMNLASKLTGMDFASALGLTQLQAEVSALMALAQKYNVPGAIDMLRAKFGHRPHLTNDIILGMGMNADLGQFDTLEQMMHLMDGQTILLMNPDIIKRVISNYRFPIKYTDGMIEKEQQRVIKLFNKIDPNWDKEVIEGKTYYLLSPWSAASPDMQKLFMHHATYGRPVCIANQYPAITLRDGLNQTYPYLNL